MTGLLIVLVWDRSLQDAAMTRIDQLIPAATALGRLGPERILAAVVGFYFGSRS